MATYTPLPLPEARRIGARLGREVLSVEGLAAGSVNSNYALTCRDGERLFLRIYEEQGPEGAAGEVALLGWLARRGVPAVCPLEDAEGVAIDLLGEQPVAVFPWVRGEICCQARVTPERAHVVGAALARIHQVGGPHPRPGRFRTSDLLARCGVIEGASSPELAAMAPRLRAWLTEVEALRSPDAPRGLCHGDLFRDNVLWEGSSLAALLDFESASDAPYTFDLAVTLLAWCYGDELRRDLAAAMVAGYQSERPLTPADLAAFHAETLLAALRFATTRVTDYAMRAPAGSKPTRDYRRFLARFDEVRRLGASGWLAFLGVLSLELRSKFCIHDLLRSIPPAPLSSGQA
jgi:homoserine kinase type II